MARLLRVPEISAGSTEAVLAAWPLAENVPYSAAEVIATVETAKAVIDIEADEDGVILRWLVGEGANVTVGQPIALIGVPGEPADDIEEILRTHGVAPASPAAPSGVPAAAGAAPPAGSAVPATGAVAGNGQRPRAGQQRETGRIFVSPLARRLAREAELDLRVISGTGPGGRIMRRDVEQAIQAARTGAAEGLSARTAERLAVLSAPAGEGLAVPSAPADARTASRPGPAESRRPARYTAVPHSRVRTAIAARLTESTQTIPHFYVAGSARADKLMRLRAELNDGPSTVRVSVNDLVIKAVARAHQLVPAMNVTWTPEAMLSYDSVDVGVAIASQRGLVTPVLRSVEQYPISALAAAVADLVERAAAGRLQQRELEGGTTSVTNLGMFGVEQFSAIINPPQSSILAVGAVHDAPVVTKAKLGVGSVLQVTLSADHRAVDGTIAAEWMKAFVGIIEHPVQILA
ncbi:MAG: dihydrolipoamide acetyltransferase family protein [Streptosporangiaceae bacterium]